MSMDTLRLKALKSCIADISAKMDPNSVIPKLQAEYILTRDQAELTMSRPTSSLRNMDIVHYVQQSGEKGFDIFIKVLHAVGNETHHQIANAILNQLRKEVEKDRKTKERRDWETKWAVLGIDLGQRNLLPPAASGQNTTLDSTAPDAIANSAVAAEHRTPFEDDVRKLKAIDEDKIPSVLDQHRTYIVENLSGDLAALLDKMAMVDGHGSIPVQPMHIIKASGNALDRIRALLDFLKGKGSDEFCDFIDALVEVRQKKIITRMAKNCH